MQCLELFVSCGCFFFQAEDGIRDLVRSRGLGDVYKRQPLKEYYSKQGKFKAIDGIGTIDNIFEKLCAAIGLSLIHI